jgi:hypothetical protein
MFAGCFDGDRLARRHLNGINQMFARKIQKIGPQRPTDPAALSAHSADLLSGSLSSFVLSEQTTFEHCEWA